MWPRNIRIPSESFSLTPKHLKSYIFGKDFFKIDAGSHLGFWSLTSKVSLSWVKSMIRIRGSTATPGVESNISSLSVLCFGFFPFSLNVYAFLGSVNDIGKFIHNKAPYILIVCSAQFVLNLGVTKWSSIFRV